MTTSANPENEDTGAVCTPQSFVKGLYLLAKSFVKDCAIPLVLVALLMLLLTISSIPAVNNYHMEADDFALASVLTFMLSAGYGALAYFKKPYRYEFLMGTLFLVMIHMLSAMMTTMLAPAFFQGDTWWQSAPALFTAAVLPVYVTMVLLQFAAAGAAVALVVWGLIKLPKATRAAARYICRTGQGG